MEQHFLRWSKEIGFFGSGFELNWIADEDVQEEAEPLGMDWKKAKEEESPLRHDFTKMMFCPNFVFSLFSRLIYGHLCSYSSIQVYLLKL